MITEIIDISDERLDIFKTLRDKQLKKDELIIAETFKVVTKLIKQNHLVYKILCSKEDYEKFPKQQKDSIEFLLLEKDILKEIIGHNLHHGVMALAKRPKFVDLTNLDHNILIMNGLTAPENVGAIIRTACGLNIKSIIVDKKTVSPYIRRAIRVSMGNIFSMKVHYTDDLVETIKKLKKLDYQVISTIVGKDSISIFDNTYKEKNAIIIGSEGHGVDPEINEVSTISVKIPIDEDVAAFNASNAATIFLYDLFCNLRK